MSEATTTSAAPEPQSLQRRPAVRLGDIVVGLGFADRETVEAIAQSARESGEQIGQVLLERGVITPDQLAVAMAKRFGLRHLSGDDLVLDPDAAQLVSLAAARRMRAVPIGFAGDHLLRVAVASPDNYLALEDVSMFTGMQIEPVVVSAEDLDQLLKRLSVLDGESVEDEATLEADDTTHFESPDDAPTIKLVRSIISEAVDRGVSDVHFAPGEGGTLSVRFRIDGVMVDGARVPRSQAPAVISRIKILADLDISEKRLPQDGRIGIVIEDRRVDIRVAVVPLVGGEAAVLRILDAGRSPLSLDDLGMTEDDRTRLAESLGSTHGGILATGPTGSGKTTSLYAMMALARSPEKTLMTIEDPVEYRLTGINQIQVSERTGLSFATGLRAIVRADPDIIMVGEIRDRESAHIAIDAALTGHLVLSTLHTNDAPAAPMRLVDMGIEPYLVASSINCVIAQRLARRVCSTCRQAVTVAGSAVGLADGECEIYEAAGCPRCRNTGYRGRIGLYEVMNVSEEIRSLIVSRAPAQEIAAVAVAQGMATLRDDGFTKVREGATTLVELTRVLG
ncbi:MAG TPA: ATPase, T2SS/T4P/T4SS family [Solirubrobacteraceae bacterium]|jgi:type IV pilus assembly protein PilB|nr:ATPase, T2SS/T4P/T4SS family [Solirubrobacteraceae bacterium]